MSAAIVGHGGDDQSQAPELPHDIAAEQSTLGSMMLSKDAIADVLETGVKAGDFFRYAHRILFDKLLDLYAEGTPTDAIVLGDELGEKKLQAVGGASYLLTLVASVPTAVAAAYYAEIVVRLAIKRRLIESGTRIVQLGYHGDDTDDSKLTDLAQSALDDVTDEGTDDGGAQVAELVQPMLETLDEIATNGGPSQGVSTGFIDLDEVTNGLHPGQMVIVAARPGVGKALALDTPLPTPGGWTTMGEVATGDELIGAHGKPVRVLRATEVLEDRRCFEVEFSDGALIVADAEHQWRLADGSVRTTGELAQSGSRPALPAHAAFELPERELPVSPYTLGVWLAAGDRAELPPDQALEKAGLHRNGHKTAAAGKLAETLAQLDHDVPLRYLRAGAEQRRALLAGLLDAAGSVSADGALRLEVSEPTSVRVRELVLSLGYACGARLADSAADRFDQVVLVFDSGADEVFRLPAKNAEHKTHRLDRTPATRGIVGVREVAGVPVRCVEVDAPDHLYLAGRGMVPTHNSTLGLDFARAASIKHGMGSVIFSLEMGKEEIMMRLASAEARIRLGDMRGGRMTDDDWTRLARRMSEVSEAPLFVDDSPNLTMASIRAKARRLKQRSDIQLVVVDYMQLMTSGKRVESRQQEVSEFSRNLKLLAKELEVPVVAISQLNRGPEQRNDKRPQLADLRESGCLTAGTRLLRADTGAEVSFGELMRTGERPLVWSLDEQRRLVPARITNVFSSGVQPTFQMTLASGRAVTATGNHRFLGFDGWTSLDNLDIGDHLASPSRIPAPIATPHQPGASQEYTSQQANTCDALDVGTLPLASDNGVVWERIVSIEPMETQHVYDATVEGTHNFIANGIVAHNSLEQDADMVILIHRPDAFERDDPRMGEADLILAKHRAGPTSTVTVAHQLHYSRFVDMAQE